VNVLIDSSVWVEHFKNPNELLSDLIEENLIVTHPLVITEVACGTPNNKSGIIEEMKNLNKTEQATVDEVLEFIKRENLAGKGCGAVDIFLLASTIITGDTAIWTLDKNLKKLAERFNVLYQPKMH